MFAHIHSIKRDGTIAASTASPVSLTERENHDIIGFVDLLGLGEEFRTDHLVVAPANGMRPIVFAYTGTTVFPHDKDKVMSFDYATAGKRQFIIYND